MGMEEVKQHFEKTIDAYDANIAKLIPFYAYAMEAAAEALPFGINDTFSVLDLGCGTGALSAAIRKRFKNANLTCFDLSGEMLERAKARLGDNARYIEGDFCEYGIKDEYDVIMSSLALHHLPEDEDKQRVYSGICSALKSGGVFLLLDVLEGANVRLEALFNDKWIEFMEKSIPKKEIEERWLPGAFQTDRPISAAKTLDMLKIAGFSTREIILKYYGYGVVLAEK